MNIVVRELNRVENIWKEKWDDVEKQRGKIKRKNEEGIEGDDYDVDDIDDEEEEQAGTKHENNNMKTRRKKKKKKTLWECMIFLSRFFFILRGLGRVAFVSCKKKYAPYLLFGMGEIGTSYSIRTSL